MPPAARRHRGVSPEQRRRERRTRLVTACLELVEESGVAAVHAEAVAARAGLTKRYFYESFTDRDALLEELLGEFFTEIHRAIETALLDTPPDPAAKARTIAGSLVSGLENDPQRARLYIETPGYPRLQARREQAYIQFTELMLKNFPPAPGRSDDADERQRLAALLLVAGTTQAVITWLRSDIQLPRATVVDELTRVIIATLPTG